MSQTREEISASREDAAYRWVMVMQGQPTVAEAAAFQNWLEQDAGHGDAYDKAQTYWQAYDRLRVEDLDEDLLRPGFYERCVAAWDRLSQPRWALIGAACVLALAVVVVPVVVLDEGADSATAQMSLDWHDNATQAIAYTTGKAEIRAITLSDGTELTLGAETELQTLMSKSERRVVLKEGSVHLTVSSDADRPFIVQSGLLESRVLGTVFEVRHNAGVMRVAVAKGRVAVAYPQIIAGRPMDLVHQSELGVGDQVLARSDSGLGSVSEVALSDIGAWRHDQMVYKGATLQEIVADANRYLAQEIVLSDRASLLEAQPITASFRISDPEGMLEMLSLLLPVVIQQDATGQTRIDIAEVDH
ncbi:MAG: FecR domain-containing protein [Pseudomonadota bacterium]